GQPCAGRDRGAHELRPADQTHRVVDDAAGADATLRGTTVMTSSLQTLAEQSGYRETGRTAEGEALSAELARMWPNAVRSFEYGRSSEGRVMRALLVSRTGALSAAELK